MWKQVFPELPPEVARVTTSVWDFEGYGQVGVMRNSFLAPPVLWFTLGKVERALLKRAPELLTDLQKHLEAGVVFAEAKYDEHKSQRFLTFMGFEEVYESLGRKQYSRSI